MSRLEIIKPQINIKSKTRGKAPANTFALFESVQIDRVFVQNGAISLQSPSLLTKTQQIDISLSDIDWKFGKKQKLFKTFKLEQFSALQNRIETEKFEASIGKVKASSKWKDIDIEQIVLQMEQQPYPLSIGSAKLTGLNMRQLVEENFIDFDSLNIIDPSISILQKDNSDNSALIQQLHHMQFKMIKVTQGDITIYEPDMGKFAELKGFTGNMTKFNYDSIADEYFVDPTLTVDSVKFHLKKIDHVLTADNINFNSLDSVFSYSRLSLNPRKATKVKNVMRVTAGSTSIFGVDAHLLINNQTLTFKNGRLLNPKADIQIIEANSNRSKLPISFDNLIIENASLKAIHQEKEIGIRTYFNLSIYDFNGLIDKRDRRDTYVLEGQNLGLKPTTWEDSIKIESYKIDTRTGNISLKNITANKTNQFNSHIEDLAMTGVNFDSLILNNSLHIDSISINSPTISMLIPAQKKRNQKFELPKAIITSLNTTNAEIDIILTSDQQNDTIQLHKFNVWLDDIFSHPDSTFNPLQLVKSFRFDGANFNHPVPELKSSIRAKKYAFDSEKQELSIKRLILEPEYNRGEFQRQLEYQATWIDAEVQKFAIRGISLDSLLEGSLIAQNITVDQLNLNTHRDKRLPREPNTYKPLPQKTLAALQFPLKIDSIFIIESFISHSEFSQDGAQPGVIFFRNLNGIIDNVTNKSSIIKMDSTMTLSLTGTIMNTGDISVKSNFSYTDSLNSFTLQGEVGAMNLTELNGFLENTQSILISSGLSKSLSFKLKANENFAIGEMRFYYRDLKLTVLDKETHEKRGHGAGIKTFFANTFVLHSKNPRFLFVRKGHIFTERDKEKSVFAYWAQSAVSGLVSSIGAKNNQKAIKAHSEEIRSQLSSSAGN